MTELLPVFIICMAGAILTDMFSLYDHKENRYVYKVGVFFLVIAVVAGVFCGLRRGYNDTYAYRHLYEIVDTSQPFFSDVRWTLAYNPGFKIVYKAMAYLGWDVQIFLMAFSIFDVGTVFWFTYRHSRSFTMTVFLLFATGVYTFCFAAIMQCTATAFALIGVDLFLRRRPLGFLIFVLIGGTFHTFGLVYLIVPLMVSQPWERRTYSILLATVVAALLFSMFIRIIVGITSFTGESYTETELSSEGVNPFRLLVALVPVVLSFLAREDLRRSDDMLVNISVNLCIVHACILFLGLFGTANYFARLANYFLIFQCIALPHLVDRYFSDETGVLSVKTAMIAGYSGYFYFAEAITNGGFDAMHSEVTLRSFLALLVE
ncbi:MAG: EpsG family protein [Clostridia bacterium]|nr:EpsG family protein [Clostridia bacterium]